MSEPSHSGPVLEPGRNCWRRLSAHRIAFVVDADAYFRAFVQVVRAARRQVYVLGWDMDSRLELIRENHPDHPTRLDRFLNYAAEQNPELHINVLTWDFSMIYALEREKLPMFKLGWQTHQRVHFRMDAEHPLGASHHQKIVVVDDKLALVGGMDLARRRWDTPEHLPEDPRRVDPEGEPYQPFHDLQVCLDGEAASALGELCRRRWLLATGQELPAPGQVEGDPWPECLPPDARDAEPALARTEPAHKGREEVREVQALYEDITRAARRSLFIENQYVTSWRVGRVLAERLEEPHGPEVVIVVPYKGAGWLEESTMHALRTKLLSLLRQSDHHGRLAVYYPVQPGLPKGQFVNVHSKVQIADDEIAHVGSSNISNRSMGLDTECDVALEAGGRDHLARAVAGLRRRLLAEHLDVSPQEVGRAEERHGSLIAAIEELRGQGRTLEPLDHDQVPAWMEDMLPSPDLADPERAMDPASLAHHLLSEETQSTGWLKVAGLVLLALAALGLAAAWRWGPLSEWLSMDALVSWAFHLRDLPLAPALVLGVYVVGGVVMVPLTLLVAATAIVFTPYTALAYAFGGSLLSALATFCLGRILGRQTVQRLAGDRLNGVSKRLARHGIINMAIIRNLPVAPFSVVNAVAGASHLKLTDYLVGTAVGMTPGIVGLTVLSDRLRDALRDPDPVNFAILAGVALALVGLGLWLQRFLARHNGVRG
jgi:phosphatidylserine/phosphatidylglycerophosphate/cardiolipin synthase-like enzyme/uncharacterized membrane protein YdjX (TVP38/TMEM64 family)